jgi:hypothetical protein
MNLATPVWWTKRAQNDREELLEELEYEKAQLVLDTLNRNMRIKELETLLYGTKGGAE